METYLDNSATTKVYAEVVDVMKKTMEEDYGNPSSKHICGVRAENYIKNARELIAATLKCQPKEILFTSGGTESNNMAIIGGAYANKRSGMHILTSAVEHSSVKEPMRFLAEMGFEVEYLKPDAYGVVSPRTVAASLRPDTVMVSVMYVNNEIGTVEPVEAIGRAVKEYNPNILYHVDAIQAYGKFRIVPKNLKIDLLSVSGHKIHGPKGTGFLYIKDKTKIKPIIFGGGQQNGMRSGTENVPGIAGLGRAAEIVYKNLDRDRGHMYALQKRLIDGVSAIEGTKVNGPCDMELRAPHIVSVSFAGVRSEVLLHALEERGIYVSSGSACSSNKPALSNTLVAIGLERELLDSTLRFSLCGENTPEQIDYTIEALKELVPQLRRFVRR